MRDAIFCPTMGLLSGLYIALFWSVQFAQAGMLGHAIAFFLTFLLIFSIFLWVYFKNKKAIQAKN